MTDEAGSKLLERLCRHNSFPHKILSRWNWPTQAIFSRDAEVIYSTNIIRKELISGEVFVYVAPSSLSSLEKDLG